MIGCMTCLEILRASDWIHWISKIDFPLIKIVITYGQDMYHVWGGRGVKCANLAVESRKPFQ